MPLTPIARVNIAMVVAISRMNFLSLSPYLQALKYILGPFQQRSLGLAQTSYLGIAAITYNSLHKKTKLTNKNKHELNVQAGILTSKHLE